jgi:O-antigen/teichoic acid export membrane protein
MTLFSAPILAVFKEEYVAAQSSLTILLLAQFLRASSLTFSFMFIIRDKVRYLNIILVVALIINLISNVVFIRLYGIEGAALATLISNGVLLFSVLTLFMMNKLLQIPEKSQADGEQIA